MATNIKHQLFFRHAPEAVWDYLTNSALMEIWLMKNDFQPILGHEFQFRINPMPSLDFDGIVYCKVLEIAPFKRLSYSWKLGPGDGTLNIDSVVRWELKPKDNGTELLLDHGDFAIMENLGIFNSMYEGWLKNMHKLAGHLDMAIHGTTNA
jgi:uncharacterized protein YndB with AHSA1/START domain